jgi:squalene cyclase
VQQQQQQPHTRSARAGAGPPVARAVEQGVRFLLTARSPDGAWRDFQLQPGVSDSWVTAYVTSCLLRALSSTTGAAVSRSTLGPSRDWLRRAVQADGGWAYNDRCPVDSDSTAHAVLSLSECGDLVPNVCYERLLTFQKPDGGFATFDPRTRHDAWGMSHPDVTPVVLRALLTRLPLSDPRIRRGLRYVVSQLQPSGTWPSYWWTTALYSTSVNVRLLEQTRTAYDRERVVAAVRALPAQDDPFRSALAGDILSHVCPDNSPAGLIGDALVRSQCADGSWRALKPALRETYSRYREPWAADEYVGRSVVDHCHLFTTATVLRFLAGLQAAVTAGDRDGSPSSSQE